VNAADHVLEAIKAQQAATVLIEGLRRGCASPDLLHDTVKALPIDELRCFLRTIQKELERPVFHRTLPPAPSGVHKASWGLSQ